VLPSGDFVKRNSFRFLWQLSGIHPVHFSGDRSMGNVNSWSAALLLFGAVALVGCGGGDTGNRAEVKGRVTLDGQPISEGAVNLIPMDGDTGRVGGPISQGEYAIPRDRGPAPGKYRVEIFGFEPVAGRQRRPK
jgi:hypothetical protein